MAGSRRRSWEEGENVMKERKKNMGWQNNTEKLKRLDQVAVARLRTGYRLPVLQRKTHTRHTSAKKNERSMGERRRTSKNAGRKNEERTNKKRLRKPQMNKKKDNEDRQRKLKLRKT
jgi:hypothetical protein